MLIERVTAATPEIVEALARLVPQLTQRNQPPTRDQLATMVANADNVLVIARWPDSAGSIVGAGSLGVYTVPTGIRAVIEDVVVDAGSRGRGVGEAITSHLVELARQRGAHGVSLTSNPRREAANRLYLRLGFRLRQTNSYYLELEH